MCALYGLALNFAHSLRVSLSLATRAIDLWTKNETPLTLIMTFLRLFFLLFALALSLPLTKWSGSRLGFRHWTPTSQPTAYYYSPNDGFISLENRSTMRGSCYYYNDYNIYNWLWLLFNTYTFITIRRIIYLHLRTQLSLNICVFGSILMAWKMLFNFNGLHTPHNDD